MDSESTFMIMFFPKPYASSSYIAKSLLKCKEKYICTIYIHAYIHTYTSSTRTRARTHTHTHTYTRTHARTHTTHEDAHTLLHTHSHTRNTPSPSDCNISKLTRTWLVCVCVCVCVCMCVWVCLVERVCSESRHIHQMKSRCRSEWVMAHTKVSPDVRARHVTPTKSHVTCESEPCRT